MYNPTESTPPKEINHDVMFREGKNLQVRFSCFSMVSVVFSDSSIEHRQ